MEEESPCVNWTWRNVHQLTAHKRGVYIWVSATKAEAPVCLLQGELQKQKLQSGNLSESSSNMHAIAARGGFC